jgi:hypothetical protein
MSPAGRSGPIVSLHFPPATLLEHRSIIKTSFVETTSVADAAKTLPRRPTTATAKKKDAHIVLRLRYAPERNKTRLFFKNLYACCLMLYGSLAIRSNVLRELSGHEQRKATHNSVATMTKKICRDETPDDGAWYVRRLEPNDE